MNLMQFLWSKSRKRHALLELPFPDAWLGYLSSNVAYSHLLPEPSQQKLRDITRIIIAEKSWEGCGGLTLTDEIRVTIAAQAAILVLGFDEDYYLDVESILVYPHGFLVTTQQGEAGRVIREDLMPLSGEAAMNGPVIVSWQDARHGGLNSGDGHNVVLHEFAHKLDMRDGAADGVPYLQDAEQVTDWERVMSSEFDTLVLHCQAGERTLLDHYGATNPAEFFAVATECFFEKPRPMQRHHPELYTVLRDFYRQDPAALFAAQGRD